MTQRGRWNILLLLREAMAFVKANTRKGWEKLPDGRRNKPEYAESRIGGYGEPFHS